MAEFPTEAADTISRAGSAPREASAVLVGACLMFLIAFLVAVGWLVAQPETYLVSLPAILFTALLMGLLLILLFQVRPAGTGIALLAVTYLVIDVSVRPQAEGASSIDLQTVLKMCVYGTLFVYGVVNGTLRQWNHPLLLTLSIYALICFATAAYTPTLILAIGGGITLVAVALSASAVSAWTESDV